jgi:predicted MFS family arabinose efflux permease
MPRLLANARMRKLFGTAYAEGLLISGPFAFIAVSLQNGFAIGPGLSGTLVAAWAAGGLVYALLARRAVRRLGERGMVALGGAALALGYAGLALSGSLAVSTLSIATVGAGFYMFHTTVQIHVTQVAPEERGSTVALFATFLFLGQASGVWLAARVIDAAGAMPVFLIAALGLAALALWFRGYFLSAGGT